MIKGWRKFLAFLVACTFLWFNKISDDIWLIAFVIFVGGNLVTKFIPRAKE